MKITKTAIDGVVCIAAPRFTDTRGWFSESWNRTEYAKHDIHQNFIQDNISYSKNKGTIRGLHFQRSPFAQTKLVSVLRGKIIDVAVDLRPQSKTYGQHVAIELDDQNGHQILIPHGCAHGFCTLTDDVIVAYKVDAHYARDHEAGIIWNDPTLAIDWHLPVSTPILSDKDMALPSFKDLNATILGPSEKS